MKILIIFVLDSFQFLILSFITSTKAIFYYFNFIIIIDLSMNVYLLIALNLATIALVSFFIVDSNQQFYPFKIQPLCLNIQDSTQLCALCYRRDPIVLKDRAIKIESSEEVAVLKIGQQQTYLTCHDYLQFISLGQDSKNKGQILIQQVSPIFQIMSQIKAVINTVKAKSVHLVQPQYNQFVIYKWGNFSNEKTKVTFPNTDYYKSIAFYFGYGFNFILLLVLVAWIADSTFLAQQSTPIKICLTSIVIFMELWALDIGAQICLYLCRLLVLNIGLFRLKVNNFKVIGLFGIGLLLTYFQVTIPIYATFILVLMVYYGKSQTQSSKIQRYLFVFYTLFLLNHLYIFNFVYLLNDFRNVAIDLCIIIMIPLGLFLLPNEKKFKPYRPVDPEIRSISLSGYEEQEHSSI